MENPQEHQEVEIMDTENFKGGDDAVFSHQGLVMMAMKKITEYGCQELIQGYYSTDTDQKTGKTKIIYKQDTRKAFIESVRTLRMIMICDFDEEAKGKLIANKKSKEDPDENVLDKLNKIKTDYLEKQKKWWDDMSKGQQDMAQKNGFGVIPEYFNTNLPFYQQYFLDELEVYREIFEELTLLTSRKKFYAAEAFSG